MQDADEAGDLELLSSYVQDKARLVALRRDLVTITEPMVIADYDLVREEPDLVDSLFCLVAPYITANTKAALAEVSSNDA